jgi:nicotinamide mononucleotide (NMN) deamidase PncC
MLSDERTRLITQIHDSPLMAVIVATGGGSRALADLAAVPGASRTILEGLIPYCDTSLTEFLKATPEQVVSSETGVALARRGFERARILRPREGMPVIGVACTATLATDRPKKGAHRMHVAVCGDESIKVYSLTLKKGARTRACEERVAADLVLRAITEACGIPSYFDSELFPEEEVSLTESPRQSAQSR